MSCFSDTITTATDRLVRNYILENLLNDGESIHDISDDTEIDPVTMQEIASFIECTFSICVEADALMNELGSINDIVRYVVDKTLRAPFETETDTSEVVVSI